MELNRCPASRSLTFQPNNLIGLILGELFDRIPSRIWEDYQEMLQISDEVTRCQSIRLAWLEPNSYRCRGISRTLRFIEFFVMQNGSERSISVKLCSDSNEIYRPELRSMSEILFFSFLFSQTRLSWVIAVFRIQFEFYLHL